MPTRVVAGFRRDVTALLRPSLRCALSADGEQRHHGPQPIGPCGIVHLAALTFTGALSDARDASPTVTLTDLLAHLRGASSASTDVTPAELRLAAAGFSLSVRELERLADASKESAERGDTADAVRIFLLGLTLGPEPFLRRVRRIGVLRPRAYQLDLTFPAAAVRRALEYAADLGLGADLQAYLESVNALQRVASVAASMQAALRQRLAGEPASVLRGLQVTLERLFMSPWRPVDATDGDGTSLTAYSTEKIAEGFSFLWHLYEQDVGDPADGLTALDSAAVLDGRYVELVVLAVLVRRVDEWAVLVDSLDYRCVWRPADQRVELRARDTRTEQALRFGFIQRDMQATIAVLRTQGLGAASLDDVARRMYREYGARFAAVRTAPLRRVVMGIPAAAFSVFAGSDGLYAEEIAQLDVLERSHLLPRATLLASTVIEDVTVLDLLKAHRVFVLLRLFATEHLTTLWDDDPELVLNSLVPRYTVDQMEAMLTRVLPPAKARTVLALLTRAPGDTRVFDVMYQPLVRIGDGYAAPVMLLGAADLVRNAFQLASTRPGSGDGPEPMEGLLTQFFRDRGAAAERGVKFAFQGEQGEIDVLALFDGALFVLECKTSAPPASAFELRTTLGHVDKAVAQLTRLRRLLADPAFRADLTRRVGWEVPAEVPAVTGIVLSNRMLSGIHVGGHAVRSFLELQNVLRTGLVATHAGPANDPSARKDVALFPSGGPPTGPELRDYFETGAAVYNAVFGAMRPAVERYRYGTVVVEFHTFRLQSLELITAHGVHAEALETSSSDAEPA